MKSKKEIFPTDFAQRRCTGKAFVTAYVCDAVCVRAKNSCYAMNFDAEKSLKSRVFDKRKTPLRCLLDTFLLLTFFDAVVIAIATCSYRDSNMMLST